MTLNLVHTERGGFNFKINKFPDGQQDVVILGPKEYIEHDTFLPVVIYSRFNGWKDLEIIIASVKALRRLGYKDISLFIPYLLGARSDRKFVEGGTSYLVDVVAPVLNSLRLQEIQVLDVHSDVAAACIENLYCIDNFGLIRFALKTLGNTKDLVIISPDAGALKKIYPVMEFGGLNQLVVATKHRDIATGKILSTEVPLDTRHFKKNFVIIDDICDGGRTFIEIAKKVKNEYPDAAIYLIVTHGIFSAGFGELGQYFSRIYTTNSISDIDNSFIKQMNVFI